MGLKRIDGGARRRRVRRRRVSNGCKQPVFRPEMSRGRVPGAVGNDAASSAQSKRVGAGIEGSSVGLRWGSTRDGDRGTAAAGDSDLSAVVDDVGNGETPCL